MVFSSLLFLYIFLPICIGAYYLVRSLRAKNAVLIAASLVFYAWGEPVYVLLLVFSAAMNYGFGLLMEKYRHSKLRKLFFVLCVNLLIHRGFLSSYPAKLIIESNHVKTEIANKPLGFGLIDADNFSSFSKNPAISKFFL